MYRGKKTSYFPQDQKKTDAHRIDFLTNDVLVRSKKVTMRFEKSKIFTEKILFTSFMYMTFAFMSDLLMIF